jgi:drug/metabolite transporter (DMT)-like permease
MTAQTKQADAQSWSLLLLLSAIWGGSFFFIAIAVKELDALQIVLARVGIAAALLIPIHLFYIGGLPRDSRTWIAAAGMSVMNNICPFLLITWGQHYIAGGLASVINATTPMFTVLFLALFGLEAVTTRRITALIVGFIGVVILKGGNFGDLSVQSLGILAVVLASGFYGLSAPWSKTRLKGIAPLTTATCQLTISAVIMAVIVGLFGNVQQYASVSTTSWAALIGLAALSTSFAYLLFFRIIERSGPSFVSLVTMIIPVFAILLGTVFLGERLTLLEVAGAAVIGLALLIIDGRLLMRLGIIKAGQ